MYIVFYPSALILGKLTSVIWLLSKRYLTSLQFLSFNYIFINIYLSFVNRYAKVQINASKPIVPFRETVIEPPKVDMVNEVIQEQTAVKKVYNFLLPLSWKNIMLKNIYLEMGSMSNIENQLINAIVHFLNCSLLLIINFYIWHNE